MKKTLKVLAVFALVLSMAVPPMAQAAVSVTAGPVSLATEPMFVKASSNPIGLFDFTLSATAGETLSGVSVLFNNNATSTVEGGNLANLSIYRDAGSAGFNPSEDTLLTTQNAVSIGTSTMITLGTSGTTTPATGRFYVSVATSGSWSDANPADSVTVTLPSGSIMTMAGTSTPASLTITAVTTAAITADTTGPLLSSAMARNSGGTAAKEAGDSVELMFSEPTNKPAINTSNINSFFSLNNGHSFLSATGTLGSTLWDESGRKLTITFSADNSTTSTSTLATVQPADVVTVNNNSSLMDLAGNPATGTQSITGSFGTSGPDSGNGGDDVLVGSCANGLTNGRLYKTTGEATVYLAASCRPKPFRGNAVFRARGHKFENIVVLSTRPADTVISTQPVLPSAGTLIKGSDRTVWFVTKEGNRRGFVSGEHFLALGFNFGRVMIISDSDLSQIPSADPIQTNENHPDGALIKCTASPAVFQVISGRKFPFVAAQAFESRGHTFDQVLSINCTQYNYATGAPITQ